jgi:hypothetical protein
MRCRLTTTFMVGLSLAVFLRPAMGQGAGMAAIRGVVVDEAGLGLAGVRVEAVHGPTGAQTWTLSDGEGRYHLANLRPGGPYTVRATRLAFSEALRQELQLQAGSTLRLDLALTPAAILLPGVEVRAQHDARFGQARTGAATVLDRRAVAAHPTVGRNVAELAALSPMAVRSTEGISIAGQNQRYNSFQLDGTLHQDVFGFGADGLPGSQAKAKPIPLQAVEQYQIMVAPFDARHTGFTGGIMNVVTRSGTNEWEAAGFGHFRNEALLGELQVDGLSVRPAEFESAIAGFALGGPIRRDRAHAFVAVETEWHRAPPVGFSIGEADPLRTRLVADSVATLSAILREYGIEPGEMGPVTLESPNHNVFFRLDVRPSDRHRITLRYNLTGARADMTPNRQGFGDYELSSYVHRMRSRSHSVVTQLVSSLGRISNEFVLHAHWLRDAAEPWSDAPHVAVQVQSEFGEAERWDRWVRAGGNPSAHTNDLRQRILEARNDVTVPVGDHVVTFGASAELFAIDSRYLPGAGGTWLFGSIQALRDNAPLAYERNLLYEGADPAVGFSVLQLGGYLQNVWTPADGLSLHFGGRLDLPLLRDQPGANAEFERQFGLSTDAVPRAMPLFSPRVGFNWQREGGLRTQLRGGTGLFTGRLPLVWLANAFAFNGMTSAFLVCRDGPVPRLDPDALPESCGPSSGASPTRPIINLIAADFRFPQDLKVALGVDQEMPFGFSLSGDVVYTRAVNQIALEDLNVGPEVFPRDEADGYSTGFGFRSRPAFGTATPTGFRPVHRSDDFAQVIRMGRGWGNAALAVSVELERGFGQRLRARGGYTYTRSVDRQSLVGRDLATNLGSTAIAGHPNHPPLARANFDRPHKVFMSLWGRPLDRWGGTDIALFYVGQSGAPYSYVYASDINGDGYPGPGTADAYNDLFYVPMFISEFPAGPASTSALLGLIAAEPCLNRNRGRIMARNECRAPWVGTLDLRVTQGIPLARGDVRLAADLLNVLNLLNNRWGQVRHTSPLVPIAEATGRPELALGGTGGWDPLVVSYVGPTRRNPATNRFTGALPHSHVVPASQWQAQIGVQIGF